MGIAEAAEQPPHPAKVEAVAGVGPCASGHADPLVVPEPLHVFREPPELLPFSPPRHGRARSQSPPPQLRDQATAAAPPPPPQMANWVRHFREMQHHLFHRGIRASPFAAPRFVWIGFRFLIGSGPENVIGPKEVVRIKNLSARRNRPYLPYRIM